MVTLGDAILAINPDAVFEYEDIDKIYWQRNRVSPLHHDRIPHAGAPDVDRASCLREVVDKEQRTRSWQYRTNMKH